MAFESINWGLAQPVDVGGAFSQGWQRGQALRQQTDQRNALAAYAQNPTMDTANAVIPYDPSLGLQLKTQQHATDREAAQRAAMVSAFGGDGSTSGDDPNAAPDQGSPLGANHPSVGRLIALGVDPKLAMDIDERHIKAIGRTADFLGNVGLRITTIKDEGERARVWAEAVRQAPQYGIPVPPDYRQYSPQALEGIIATAHKTKEAIDLAAPRYQPVTAGGELRNTNPLAGEVNTGIVGAPASPPRPIASKGEYDALAPGAPYIAPDGSHRVKGGQTSQASGGFLP